MENERESREKLKAMKNVRESTSWFRDTPHYWAEASLPLAYAAARMGGELVIRGLDWRARASKDASPEET